MEESSLTLGAYLVPGSQCSAAEAPLSVERWKHPIQSGLIFVKQASGLK